MIEENVLKPVINALKPIILEKDEIKRTYEKIKNTNEWGFYCPTHGWVEVEEGLIEHEHVWIDDWGEEQGIIEYIPGYVCKICHRGVYNLPKLDDLKSVVKYGKVYERISDTIISENGCYVTLDYKSFPLPDDIASVLKMLAFIKKVYDLFEAFRIHTNVRISFKNEINYSLYSEINRALSEIDMDEIIKMTGDVTRFDYTICSALFKAGKSIDDVKNYEIVYSLDDYKFIDFNLFINCDFILYERKVIGRKNSNAKEKIIKILNSAAEKYYDLERKAYENNKKNPPEVPFIAQWASGGVYKDPYRRVVLLLSSDKKYIDDEIIVLEAELRPSRNNPGKNYWVARKWTTRKMIFEEALKNCR